VNLLITKSNFKKIINYLLNYISTVLNLAGASFGKLSKELEDGVDS
jgi:hypothetical protein